MAPVFADLTGDGAGDEAAVIHCSAGGVSWPDTIVFYGPGTQLLGAVELVTVHAAEHFYVTSMTAIGGDIEVGWNTSEGAGSNPTSRTARLYWAGSKIIIGDPQQVG